MAWRVLVLSSSFSLFSFKLFTTHCDFFTPALRSGFSPNSKWQQISSDLQDSSKYPGRFQWCYDMDNLDLTFDPMCCIAVIHIQLYTYTCGNIINNNDERTQFFRKIYLAHFIRKGCNRVVKRLCVRGALETEQTATYWPPVLLTIATPLFSFCWAAQPGVLRAHPSAGSWFSLPRTSTATDSN